MAFIWLGLKEGSANDTKQTSDGSVGEAPKDAHRVGGEYGGGENLRRPGKNLQPVGGERGTRDQVKNMCATGREEEEGWEGDEGGRDSVVAKASIGNKCE